MDLDYRIPGQWDEDSPSKQEIRKLQERMGEIEKDSKGMPSSFSLEIERTETRLMKDARKERERVKAEHDRQLVDLNRRLQDMANASAADRLRLEQEVRERQRTEAELADLACRLQDEIGASAAYRTSEQKAREEKQQAEVEHKQRLIDLERHLWDLTTTASAADRAKWEEIRRHQAKLMADGETTKQRLKERTRELQGQIERIEKNSEGLEDRMKEMEERAEEVRERAEAERRRRLIDSTRRLQDESVAQRPRSEQEVREAEHKPQLTDPERHLRDAVNTPAADRAKWEQIEQHRAELKEKEEVTTTRHLQDETNTYAVYRQKSELERRERQPAEAERNRRPQDETNASVAHRVRSEQEMKPRDRVATAVTMLPCPPPCVQVLFCFATHSG